MTVQVLGMPYKSDDMMMYVFLPKKRDGLAAFESSLTGERLNNLMRACREMEVVVSWLVNVAL